METSIMGYIGLYRDYMGIMEKKIETTIVYRSLSAFPEAHN